MEIKNQQIERLIHALDKVYGKPSQIVRRGFLIGFASGAGGIIGAAITILLLGFLVSKLGGLPLIGDILERINQAIPN